MELSDNEIVKQVREGNIEAFSEIVQRYQKPVFNLMYRFSQSEHDATELTQDIFCKAYGRLANFQNERSFFPWLYTVAMNHGRDWIHRQDKNRDGLRLYTDSLEHENQLLPPEIVEKQQESTTLLMALSTLSSEKRELLLQRYQQDLSI